MTDTDGLLGFPAEHAGCSRCDKLTGIFEEQDSVHNHEETHRHGSDGGAISHYFR